MGMMGPGNEALGRIKEQFCTPWSGSTLDHTDSDTRVCFCPFGVREHPVTRAVIRYWFQVIKAENLIEH